MTEDEYLAEDMTGIARLVAAREISAAEALEAAIAREAAANPSINAIAQRLHEAGREAVASGPPSGPLGGAPYLMKDIGAHVRGAPTRAGSRMTSDAPAERDSEITTRLRRAGVVIFGKTTTPELGMAAATETTLTGDTRNPWDLALSPGGSSGGAAAAVAAGVVAGAHASDGGGSIRIPAACCGLFGLKPSRGRVSFAPDAGEGWGGLVAQHAVTRTVRDSAALLDAVAGPAPGDPYAGPPSDGAFAEAVGRPPGRLKVALQLTPHSGVEVDPACRDAALDAARLMEAMGCEVEEAAPAVDWAELADAIWTLVAANVALTVRALFAGKGRAPARGDMERATWFAFEHADALQAEDYAAAITAMHRLSRAMAAFHERCDVLLTPALAAPPQPIGAQHMDASPPETYLEALGRMTAFTQLANMSGQPSMSVPVGQSDAGLPLGVLLTAPFGSEARLFSLAAAFEAERPWAGRRPTLAARTGRP